MQMRIGIDARLALGRRRGMGRVLLGLLTHLMSIDTKNTYFLYLDRPDIKGVLPKASNVKTRVAPPHFYPLWEQICLPIVCKKDDLDILHCPANTGPLSVPKQTKLVLTIHDVIFLKSCSEIPLSGSVYQNLGRVYRRLCVRLLRSRVDHVITVSQFSKYDIQRSLKIPEERITVIPNGIDDRFFQKPMKDCEIILRRLQINGKFVFHLGGIAPNKNTIGAIKAYDLLLQEGEYRDLYLVIGGISLEGNNKIKQFVKERGLEERVKFVSYVTDEELKCLYSKAELFLFPSLYEGFGLPPLEAMACGTPVVASNTSSIPEAVGEAGILVDPNSIGEIKVAMANILRDEQLKAKVIELGRQRAQKFRWERSAEKLLQVYEGLLKI